MDSFTAKSIYQHGYSFLEAGNFTTDAISAPNNKAGWNIIYPAFVLGAFALELFMKAVIYETTRRAIRNQHNLLKLYAKLPTDIQTAWNKDFDGRHLGRKVQLANPAAAQMMGLTQDYSLVGELSVHADHFTSLRYVYENRSDFQHSNFTPLIDSFLAVIQSRWPEWNE